MQLRVRSITYLAEAINGYELVDPRGRDLPRFEAGAHVDLRIGGFLRQYSLWNDPAERRHVNTASVSRSRSTLSCASAVREVGSALARLSDANESWMSGSPGMMNAPMSTLVVTPTLAE